MKHTRLQMHYDNAEKRRKSTADENDYYTASLSKAAAERGELKAELSYAKMELGVANGSVEEQKFIVEEKVEEINEQSAVLELMSAKLFDLGYECVPKGDGTREFKIQKVAPPIADELAESEA